MSSPAPDPSENSKPATTEEEEEHRLLRKRAAARLRQQRCRARKRQAHLEKKLETLSGPAAEEVRQQLAQVQAIAGPFQKGSHSQSLYAGARHKGDDMGSPKSAGGYPPPGYMPMSPSPWGIMPPHFGHPAAMGYYGHHPMMMKNAYGKSNPLTCPPDVMGIPAKHVDADIDRVHKVLGGIPIPDESKEMEV